MEQNSLDRYPGVIDLGVSCGPHAVTDFTTIPVDPEAHVVKESVGFSFHRDLGKVRDIFSLFKEHVLD